MQLAFVFPGQGSQSVGMMDGYAAHPVVRETFAEASAALGEDLWQLVAEGPQEALALTKMDWNNDALYDPVPVTIRYSKRLARTIANVPSLPGRDYPYRLFM